MGRNAAAWATIVQREVGYCFEDQPRDRDFYWCLGQRTEIRDLLESLAVPEHLRERVARRIRCPYCGNRGFDLDDEVGVYEAWERESQRRAAEWSKRWKPELDAFAKYLSSYPYLGMDHPMGRRIAAAIDELATQTLDDELWWRARQPSGARDFDPSDMLPPPPRLARAEGRYNHFGQAVFYLASSPEGATREVLETRKRDVLAWVQPFRVKNLSSILDLTESDPTELDTRSVLAAGLVSSLRSLRPRGDSPWKPQYFVPRFVADCARRRGVAGIVFSSSRHFDRNLVVFQPRSPNIVAEGNPKLYVISTERNEERVVEMLYVEPEF